MRMIIGIDARFFGPRAKGLGRYTQKLIENLEKIDGKNVYIVFLREKDFESYFPQNKNFKKVLADFPCYGFFEQIFFPFLIGRHGIDLMHFPHFNAPIFYRKKFVVTIHDLILRHFPPKKAGVLEGLKYFIKDLAYRAVIRRAIKKSGRVVAVSEFVKKDILAHYKITPKKIRVIYEGSPDFQDSDKQKESNVAARNSFILYVGNAYPHKNLDVLIDGFLLYLDNSGDKITKLVLAGENDYFYERLKRQKSGPISKYPDRIVFSGFIEENNLPALYQKASAYVFPSLCEGFGLPPLEAMACGAPVISSDETALPEILGDAALYFNPRDPEDLAQKIKIILEDKNLRDKLINKGYDQAKSYTWKKMAEEIKELYFETVL